MEGAAKRGVEGEATETRETRKKAKVDYNEDRIAVPKKQVSNICSYFWIFMLQNADLDPNWNQLTNLSKVLFFVRVLDLFASQC